jgi:uncharacterized damage-inducible protein DinB
MAVADSLLPDFDHEMSVTRQLLERVPEDAFEWRPHEKSFSLGALAAHLTQIPHWGSTILDCDQYDMALAGRPRASAASRAEVLAAFDRTVSEMRRGMSARSDAELLAPWTLSRGGHVLLTMPRVAALRRFVLHHVIHHRGQLSVYLRLRDVPLPPFYGPTADEQP